MFASGLELSIKIKKENMLNNKKQKKRILSQFPAHLNDFSYN